MTGPAPHPSASPGPGASPRAPTRMATWIRSSARAGRAPAPAPALRRTPKRLPSRRLAGLAAVLVTGALATAGPALGQSHVILWHTKGLQVNCGVEIHAPSAKATEVLCSAAGIPTPRHGLRRWGIRPACGHRRPTDVAAQPGLVRRDGLAAARPGHAVERAWRHVQRWPRPPCCASTGTITGS